MVVGISLKRFVLNLYRPPFGIFSLFVVHHFSYDTNSLSDLTIYKINCNIIDKHHVVISKSKIPV